MASFGDLAVPPRQRSRSSSRVRRAWGFDPGRVAGGGGQSAVDLNRTFRPLPEKIFQVESSFGLPLTTEHANPLINGLANISPFCRL